MMPFGHYLNSILEIGEVRRVLHYIIGSLNVFIVVDKPFAISAEKVVAILGSHIEFGLKKTEVQERLNKYSPNQIPRDAPKEIANFSGSIALTPFSTFCSRHYFLHSCSVMR